eukprot:TRINITY_DN32601_c0_g1_i1.p1 TRINITY_DN32601_c0_g1~~TRINITY_DN32601_c0_g1_i1.p1  ORF type:complete len:800 (+),score=354.80 TRINITY_DN32601_c0_g1_i1:191-2590(+)
MKYLRGIAYLVLFALLATAMIPGSAQADDKETAQPTAETPTGTTSTGTNAGSQQVEDEAITADGLSPHEAKLKKVAAEKFEFQAEVAKLMGILINSLYSNKEIFLRELISNASDALDKIRFAGISDQSALATHPEELRIRIKADRETDTLIIEDNGIGMSREDLVNNLGTIAQSGTTRFLEHLKQNAEAAADNNLIGQFGVGFYSAFLVAESIEVTSKRNEDDKQWVWVSKDHDGFSVYEDPEGVTLGRGTRISLRVKGDTAEFLNEARLKTLCQKYSQFINFPIYVWASKNVEVEVEDDEASKDDKADSDKDSDSDETEVKDVEDEEDPDKPPEKKTRTETRWDWELVNEDKPVWTRSPKDVSEDEYTKFYKALTKDYQDPMTHIHFSAEGQVEFKSILYTPKTAPHDMFDSNKPAANIKLYVKRVFIKDENLDLLPRYLNFVKGVIDSNDLPLNVSREMLQQSKTLKVIRKKLVRKALEMFKTIADDEDADKYKDFYKQYGKALKLGLIEDSSNKARLSKLLRFETSKTDDGELISLDTYVERMPDNQEYIYYHADETREKIDSSPFLERVKAKGFEILYFTDPIDEYAAQTLTEYEGKKLLSVSKGDLKMGDEEQVLERTKKYEEEFEPLITFMKDKLDNIGDVEISNRLTSSPCVLVTSKYGYTANMERIVKAQALQSGQQYRDTSRKNLEINPRHPIVIELNKLIKDDADSKDNKDFAQMLYDSAVLMSGFTLEEPLKFAERMHKLLKAGLHLPMDAEALPEEEVPAASSSGDDDGADDEGEEGEGDVDAKSDL